MTGQLDLFENRAAAAEADAKVLTRHLYLAIDWRTRQEIGVDLGWEDHAKIRHAAEAAEGDIIFGQRGMRHLRHSTPEEVRACINTLASQRDKAALRIIKTEKKFHSFGGKQAVS